MTHLWSAYPDASPAQLTIMKHSRVSNAALGAYTATVGLHHGIAVDDPSQEERVAQFAAQVSLALGKAKKRREGGGTVDEFWSQVPEYKVSPWGGTGRSRSHTTSLCTILLCVWVGRFARSSFADALGKADRSLWATFSKPASGQSTTTAAR